MQIKYVGGGGNGATGAAGIPGITWIGAWADNVNYAVRDAVTENGSSFYCKVVNGPGTAVKQPGVTSGWETYWDVLSSGGPPSTLAWADLPDVATVPDGTIYRIDPASLIGTGKNLSGIMVQAGNGKWRPLGGQQKLGSAFGSEAAPLATNASGTTLATKIKFDVGTDIGILIGMLYQGAGIRVRAVFERTTSELNVIDFQALLGRSVASADSGIIGIVSTSVGDSNPRSIKIDQTARVIVTGAYNDTPASKFVSDSIPLNFSTSDVVADRDGFISTGALNYVTFWDKQNTLNTGNRILISYEVWWVD